MPLFPTTRWSWVEAAGDPESPQFSDALASLCEGYWYPIYGFIRSRGHTAEEAADLTQEYVTRLLRRRLFHAADPERGRFRTLLLTDCAHFLADQRDRGRAIKRGGQARCFSLDAAAADHRYHLEPADPLEPEQRFERAWALEVLNHALDRLEREETEAGRNATFRRFREFLVPGTRTATHAELAERFAMSISAVEGLLRRLRTRYGQALRATVAETLDDASETDIDDEIRDLFKALSR